MEDILSGQVVTEMTVNKIINELDDLMVLAADPATTPFVIQQQVAVGKILNRAQLVAAFIEARKPAKFKVVSNG